MNKENAKLSQSKAYKGCLSLKLVTYLLADWSNFILHIHDDYCWPKVIVCHFKMFAVGVRCVLFPSTREAIFFLCRRNGVHIWGRIVCWYPFLSMVSINFSDSTFVRNISTKNTGSKSYHVRLPDSVYVSCRTLEQPHGLSNGVKRTLAVSSGTIPYA